MITKNQTIDPFHDAFVGDIEAFAVGCGLTMEGNPAYHDRLPDDVVVRLKDDFSAAGLAERLRCDKRIRSPASGLHLLTEAKTSNRPHASPKYLLEAYQLGLHKATADGCMYAIRKRVGDEYRECGFCVTPDFGDGHIAEILIPAMVRRGGFKVVNRAAGECIDTVDFYAQRFSVWFPGVPIAVVNRDTVCNGSGDPYAVMDAGFMEALPDWREIVVGFAMDGIKRKGGA